MEKDVPSVQQSGHSYKTATDSQACINFDIRVATTRYKFYSKNYNKELMFIVEFAQGMFSLRNVSTSQTTTVRKAAVVT